MVRQDVDQRGAPHPIRVVEAHARGGARAAVVPGNEEPAVAELFHHLDLVLRHRPERIVDVVGAGFVRADTVAIAPEIGGDDVEMLGETARDLAPGHMGQRVAVQQQQGRPVAAMAQVDARAAKDGGGGFDIGSGKPFEHGCLLRRVACNLVQSGVARPLIDGADGASAGIIAAIGETGTTRIQTAEERR